MVGGTHLAKIGLAFCLIRGGSRNLEGGVGGTAIGAASGKVREGGTRPAQLGGYGEALKGGALKAPLSPQKPMRFALIKL